MTHSRARDAAAKSSRSRDFDRSLMIVDLRNATGCDQRFLFAQPLSWES